MEKKVSKVLLLACSVLMVTSCGGKGSGSGELTGTAKAVAEASKMTYDELVEAAKKEMQESKSTFKVLGLTSVLKTAVTKLAEAFDWLDEPNTEGGNTYVKNDYKDYTLLTAVEPAARTYVADFALTQDERSIADYTKSGILHNFVPSDAASLGLGEKDTMPLKGIHFNKIFWTNINFGKTEGNPNYGKTLTNIWQLAGTQADANHLQKVSFQSPVTEQINMSFLLECMDPANQARIEEAYQEYYGKAWSNTQYENCGTQWVEEFVSNVKNEGRVHTSDGDCMKIYQYNTDWTDDYIYFGAYSKMKDAAGKTADAKEGVPTELVKDGKVNLMDTVKWDYNVKGFDGYFYTMDSQILNNAEHPYMACLFARYLLNGDFYKAAIYNSKTPNADGSAGNQYGYYYPGDMPAYSATETKPTSNSYDRSKAEWKECSLIEDYSYLKDVKMAKVASIQALFNA